MTKRGPAGRRRPPSALPCPVCGAPVEHLERCLGYHLEVPDPVHGTAHLVGTADKLFRHPAAVLAASTSPRREPSLDKVTVSPCGHILLGDTAHRFTARAAELRAEQARTVADTAVADAAELIARAEAVGQPALAEAYVAAVHARSGDARGLLRALRTIVEPAAR